MTTSLQERFQSMATVFILQDKTWIERGSGLVRFVFDLKTYALKLVIRPGTSEEYECKLRPRIRSKGPRAYVVRAQSDTGEEEHILAVRFEREEDSRAFRKFVEKRDGNDTKTKSKPSADTKPQPPGMPTNDKHYEYMDPLTAAHQQQAYARQQFNANLHNGQQTQTQSNLPSIAEYIQHQHQIQSQQMQDSNINQPTNYFWNCHRCLQMNDISHTACSVCGSARATRIQQRPINMYAQPQNSTGIQQFNHQSFNNMQSQGQPQQYGNILQNMQNMSNLQAYHQTYQPSSHIIQQQPHSRHLNQFQSFAVCNPQQRNMEGHPSSHMSGGRVVYGGSGGGYGGSVIKPLVVKLTNANLEKHNVLNPPLRRNVGEIIHRQLHFLAQQSQTVQ